MDFIEPYRSLRLPYQKKDNNAWMIGESSYKQAHFHLIEFDQSWKVDVEAC